MNVLFLALDIDLGMQRGDAIHVREITRALAARGHRVCLVTATPSGRVPPLGPGVSHATRPGARDWAIVRGCRNHAKETQSDVIYERRLSPKISYALSRLLDLPFVVELNGVEGEAAMQGRSDTSPLRPWKARIRHQMLRRADAVVAVTPQLANHTATHLGIDPARIATVPNGVDTDRFLPSDAASARKSLGWGDGPWIGFVGNLVPWQGVEFAIRAMPQVLRLHGDARLAIVGDGISRRDLETEATTLGLGAAVQFLGSVPYEKVATHIAAFTVCVAPFIRRRNEALGLSPLKIYEYMATGRPVIASNLPGVREAIAQSGGGIVVPPEDSVALAESISRLLSDASLTDAMGRRAREYAEAECTWAKAAEGIEQVLTRVVRA